MSIDTVGIESADLKDYHSDEDLSLRTSALETLYGGQFTLSTQLLKPDYLIIPCRRSTKVFFYERTPFIHLLKKKVFSVSGRFWPRQLLFEKCLIHLLASSCR